MAKSKIIIGGNDNCLARLTVPTVCKQCGKTFERGCTGAWGYKRNAGNDRIHYFCSWGCVRKYDEAEAKKHDRHVDW